MHLAPFSRSLAFLFSIALFTVMAAGWQARGEIVPIASITNAAVRVMAANLNGDSQRYEPFAVRIFQGLRPDVVAIQEFNVGNNSAAEIRQFVDTAFGSGFSFFREVGAQIPNGVISRWPILAAGEWTDPQVANRDFVWARLDVPGPHDLYVVSVHLHSGGGPSSRKLEADSLKSRITATFPAGAQVILAGDFNFDSRTEAALTVFKSFLVDDPIPSDASGDADTNNGRNKPYDYILTSVNWRTNFVPSRFGESGPTFANGLVFDSRRFTPLSAVAPVQTADSGNAQHMAVVKDFRLTLTTTNFLELTPPRLSLAADTLRWNAPAGLNWRVEFTTNFTAWTPFGQTTSTTTNYAFTPGATLPRPAFLRIAYP